MKSSIFMRGTTGLNNVSDPYSLDFDVVNKRPELQDALNIDIDDDFVPKTRKGRTLFAQGSFKYFHSMNKSQAVVVKNGTELHVVKPSGTVQVGTVEDRPMYYANVESLRTYFNNGHDLGFIENETVYPWTVGSYHNKNTTKDIVGPPLNGTIICYHLGRIYMVVGNTVYSSLPLAPDLWDFSSGFMQFGSSVRECFSSGDTLYISDSKDTYAISGETIQDQKKVLLCQSPIVNGTCILLNNEQNDNVVMFVAGEKVYKAQGSTIEDITSKKLKIENSLIGASYQTKTHYYCTLR